MSLDRSRGPRLSVHNPEKKRYAPLKLKLSAALAALCCLAVVTTGCSTMKTSWRSTKKLYREYVNTDPTIDLTSEGISDKGLQRLAALFMPVDERILQMTRTLGCQDTPPESDWTQQLLSSYSWLTGVAVLDTSGTVRSQVPSVPMHPLDFAPLLEQADRYKARKQGAAVQHDEFGTVVMVAAPYFENNEWAGLVVAYFDPRTLLGFSPDPGALVVLSTDGTVWPGGAPGGEGLSGLKWDEILKGSVQGEMSVGGVAWVWQSRYLGQLNVIYLTDAREARAQKPEPKKAETPAPETGTPTPLGATPGAADAPGAPANP
jgi:hypothetical protein